MCSYVQVWQSYSVHVEVRDDLECQSSPPTLFETGSFVAAEARLDALELPEILHNLCPHLALGTLG